MHSLPSWASKALRERGTHPHDEKDPYHSVLTSASILGMHATLAHLKDRLESDEQAVRRILSDINERYGDSPDVDLQI